MNLYKFGSSGRNRPGGRNQRFYASSQLVELLLLVDHPVLVRAAEQTRLQRDARILDRNRAVREKPSARCDGAHDVASSSSMSSCNTPLPRVSRVAGMRLWRRLETSTSSRWRLAAGPQPGHSISQSRSVDRPSVPASASAARASSSWRVANETTRPSTSTRAAPSTSIRTDAPRRSRFHAGSSALAPPRALAGNAADEWRNCRRGWFAAHPAEPARVRRGGREPRRSPGGDQCRTPRPCRFPPGMARRLLPEPTSGKPQTAGQTP